MSFTDLPSDMTNHIFRFVSFKDLCSGLCRTSKLLNAFVYSVITEITGDSTIAVFRVGHKFQNVTYLQWAPREPLRGKRRIGKLENAKTSLLLDLRVDVLPKLERLVITVPDKGRCNSNLVSLCQQLASRTAFTVKSVTCPPSLIKFLSPAVRLEELIIGDDFNYDSPVDLSNFHFPLLRRLRTGPAGFLTTKLHNKPLMSIFHRMEDADTRLLDIKGEGLVFLTNLANYCRNHPHLNYIVLGREFSGPGVRKLISFIESEADSHVRSVLLNCRIANSAGSMVSSGIVHYLISLEDQNSLQWWLAQPETKLEHLIFEQDGTLDNHWLHISGALPPKMVKLMLMCLKSLQPDTVASAVARGMRATTFVQFVVEYGLSECFEQIQRIYVPTVVQSSKLMVIILRGIKYRSATSIPIARALLEQLSQTELMSVMIDLLRASTSPRNGPAITTLFESGALRLDCFVNDPKVQFEFLLRAFASTLVNPSSPLWETFLKTYSINARDPRTNNTLLMHFVLCTNENAVAAITQCGELDVGAKDSHGDTALHHMMRMLPDRPVPARYTQIVGSLLVVANFPLFLTNKMGQSAVDIFLQRGGVIRKKEDQPREKAAMEAILEYVDYYKQSELVLHNKSFSLAALI